MSCVRFKGYISKKFKVGLTNQQKEDLSHFILRGAYNAKKAHATWKNRTNNFIRGFNYIKELKKYNGIIFTCKYSFEKEPTIYYTYTVGLFRIRFEDLVYLLSCTDENLMKECKKKEERVINFGIEVINFGADGWHAYDGGGINYDAYECYYAAKTIKNEKPLYYSNEEKVSDV